MFFDLIDPNEFEYNYAVEIEQPLHISIKYILLVTNFLKIIQEAECDKNNNFNISRKF